MRIREIVLRRVAMPLVRPFRTSFGTEDERDVLLVEVRPDSGDPGWGECVAMSWPGYSAEYVDAAVDVMRRWLVPPLLAAEEVVADDVAGRFGHVVGHPMAKAAIEAAVLDAELRAAGLSWAERLGRGQPRPPRDRVDCGVSVGIPVDDSLPSLLEEVEGYVAAGYRRIKLKIQPGWDLEPVAAVRERWPDVPLQVDANQAYRRDGHRAPGAARRFGLLLVEQPLPEDDLLGTCAAGGDRETPVCLDESIVSLATAEAAVEPGAAEIVNIKPGRVGGYLEAVRIHDLCRDRGVPVWCGGMLETGIGRAANVALAALPGFTLPGDTSASGRYYRLDVTEPFVLDDGTLAVPAGPGLGVVPLPAVLAAATTWTESLSAGEAACNWPNWGDTASFRPSSASYTRQESAATPVTRASAKVCTSPARWS